MERPPVPMSGRINIVKMAILLKATYRFDCGPYQNSSDILHRNRAKNLQIHMEAQKILGGKKKPITLALRK